MVGSTFRMMTLVAGLVLAASASQGDEKAASPAPGATLSGWGGKVSLQCIQPYSISDSSSSDLITHPFRLTDDQKGAGYSVTGGGCQLIPSSGSIVINEPLDADGWRCAGKSEGSHKVETSIVACRAVVANDRLDTAPVWITVGGNIAVVAREGAGLVTKLPDDYRICNASLTAELNVGWYDDTTGKGPGNPVVKSVVPGNCANVGGATYIQAQSGGGDPRALAFYQRFAAGAFEPGLQVGSHSIPKPPETVATLPGGKKTTAPCAADLAKGGGAAVFSRNCKLPLPAGQNYRICFAENYVHFSAGNLTTWPATLLPMVLDSRLIGVAPPIDSPNDPKWSQVIGQTCRDIYDAKDILLLVGSSDSYHAEDVVSVEFTYEIIK